MTCIAQTAAHDAPATNHSRSIGPLQTLAHWWGAYRENRARSATAYLLHGLDDRTLHDIGVQRSEIESVVYANPGERRRRFTAEQV